MRQYLDAKDQHRDAILFFRMGDFYEIFFEDALIAAEAEISVHMNADHADAIMHMAGGPGWRMSAVDVDGCDLLREEAVTRIAWSAPATDAHDVRRELIRLARGET